MSAILKFDFQKRKQLRFSEVNYLNYTKRPNFSCDKYIFPKTRGKTNKLWTHYGWCNTNTTARLRSRKVYSRFIHDIKKEPVSVFFEKIIYKTFLTVSVVNLLFFHSKLPLSQNWGGFNIELTAIFFQQASGFLRLILKGVYKCTFGIKIRKSLHMWCDQAKSVWSRPNSVFILLTNCMHHFHSYILQKTPLKLINWFQRYEQLKGVKNNRKQKTFSALFGSILKSIFLTFDWFCLITSHMLPVVKLLIYCGKQLRNILMWFLTLHLLSNHMSLLIQIWRTLEKLTKLFSLWNVMFIDVNVMSLDYP